MDMNNEPVAWLYYDEWNKLKLGQTMPPDPDWFPVYTHPAKESDSTKIASEKEFWECYSKVCSENPPAKTLTDEEILSTWNELDMTSSPEADAIRYARAILRKAQEK